MVEMQETAHILRHATRAQPGAARRDRPRHRHLRRPVDRLGGGRAPGARPRAAARRRCSRRTTTSSPTWRRHMPGVGNLHVSAREWQDGGGVPAQDRAGRLRPVVRHPGRAAGRAARRGGGARPGDPRQPGAHGVRPRGASAPRPFRGRPPARPRGSWRSSRARRRPCSRTCARWTSSSLTPLQALALLAELQKRSRSTLLTPPRCALDFRSTDAGRAASPFSQGALGHMSIRGWDPLGDILSLQERMNRLFEEVLAPEPSRPPCPAPQLDARRGRLRDGRLLRRADGARRASTRTTSSWRSTATAWWCADERRSQLPARPDSFHRMERSHGAFARTFTLTHAVDPDRVTAQFRDGLLRIELPRRARRRARKELGVARSLAGSWARSCSRPTSSTRPSWRRRSACSARSASAWRASSCASTSSPRSSR